MTKKLATERLSGLPPQSYWSNTVRLEYAENPGGFLSLGAGLPKTLRLFLLTGLNVAFVTGLSWFLITQRTLQIRVFFGWAIVLGGAIGNLIDRITLNGFVVDFMNMGVGPVRTGIFNLADVAITVGFCMLAYSFVQTWPKGTISPA